MLIFQKQGYASFFEIPADDANGENASVGTIAFTLKRKADSGSPARNGVVSATGMHKVIFTDHPFSQSVATNIMYAANGDIFLHVSGDRVGSLTLSGYGFGFFCDEKGDSTGFNEILEWYDSSRASVLDATNPLQITFTNRTLTGYLVGFSARMQDVNIGLVSFTMSLHVSPSMRAVQKKKEE
jgi:hypothetical protein